MLLTSLHNPILGFLPNSLQPLGLIPSHARNPLKRQRRCIHELVLHRLCNLPARPSFEIVNDWLVVLTILKPSWKIWKSMGRIIPYMKWKIKLMSETTNQGHIMGIPWEYPWEKCLKHFETTNQLVKPARLKHCHITKPVTFDLTFVSEPRGVWSAQIPTFTPFLGDSLAQIGETSHPYWGRTILSTGGKSTNPLILSLWISIPSGKHTKSYWKWPVIVDFPIKNGDCP